MIRFSDWRIEAPDSLFAYQYDNLTRRIEVHGDLPQGWDWALLVQVGENMDIIQLTTCEGGVGADLTREQLSIGDAYYHLQLRGTNEEKVRHTNVIMTFIPQSLSGTGHWPTVPSEFLQVEQRILDINNHPPVPGENGFWMLWDPDARAYKESEFPLPEGGGSGTSGKDGFSPIVELTETAEGVEIAVTDKDGVKTATVKNGKDGSTGADGLTPYIGDNGNWFIGDEDTGVKAEAPSVSDVIAALPVYSGEYEGEEGE